jgi:hypothetical protein
MHWLKYIFFSLTLTVWLVGVAGDGGDDDDDDDEDEDKDCCCCYAANGHE